MASISSLWQNYVVLLHQYPMLTKALTSASLMFTSDIICQQYEIIHARHIIETMTTQYGVKSEHHVNLQSGCPTNVPNKTMSCDSNMTTSTSDHHTSTGSNPNTRHVEYDFIRSSHLAITGFIYSGPISHAWYNILERIVVPVSSTMILPQYGVLFGLTQRLIYDAFIFSPIAVGGYFVVRSSLEGRGFQGIYDKLQMKWQSATYASWHFWPFANVVNFTVVPIQFRVLYNNSLSLFWNAYLSGLNGKRLKDVVIEQHNTNTGTSSDKTNVDTSQMNRNGYKDEVICVCSHCRAVRA